MMIKTNKSKIRLIAMVCAVALMLASLPLTALAENFSAAVKSSSMKVYADPNGRQYLGALPKKTIVTVEEYSGGVAKIRYNGMTGYAKVSGMVRVDSFADKATTTQATRVYQKPSTNSPYASVPAGTNVHVLAVKGGVAMIEKGGNVGYVNAKHLKIEGEVIVPGAGGNVDAEANNAAQNVINKLPDSVVENLPSDIVDSVQKGEATSGELEILKEALEDEYAKQQAGKQESAAPQSPQSIEEIFASGKYSNEQLCFAYITNVMGYNDAAAAGILANISAESNFRTNANGDSGRSYGICQWFSSRRTRLINWCEGKGMDPSTLLAQLCFLEYELETYYPSVHRYMQGVSDDAQGAYDAAYYFCYHFEAPASKASKSQSRGNTARSTFYPRYAEV